MPRLILAAVCLALAATSGCKLVPTHKGAATSAQQSDTDLMAAKAESVWKPQVLPYLDSHAKDFGEVLSALNADAEAAGTKYGFRPADLGGGWNFVVRGTGTVVAANLESRAAKLQVDTTGDGKADLAIQIGPIVNGTALRDALPFLHFSDFRDQIQFAKLARALNDLAIKGIQRPTGDPVGDRVSFTGVFTYAGSGLPIALVPVAMSVEPK